MKNEIGWVKLDRRIQSWRFFRKSEYVQMWIYILTEANHEPTRWEEIDIASGEFVTSVERLSKGTGLSTQQVRTILKKLNGEELTIKSTNRYSLIKVNKWAEYQGSTKVANKQSNKQITNEQQTANKQLTTNKNDKNEKNEKNIYIIAPSSNDLEPVARLPLNEKGTYHNIYPEDVAHYRELYPGTDVEQSLRNMVGWLEANPQRRKTKRGVSTFINNWLAKEQNRSKAPMKGGPVFFDITSDLPGS